MEAYKDRTTWMNEVVELQKWKLKFYVITAKNDNSDDVVAAAKDFMNSLNDFPESNHGCGFAILHLGQEANWLLIDLWYDDIVHHYLYRAQLDQPKRFEVVSGDHTMACVWELEVVKHERDAWVEHVLSRPENPDLEDYLTDGLSIEVS